MRNDTTARIYFLKQELYKNGFKDPKSYWGLINTDDNLQVVLDHIALFIPPTLENNTFTASAELHFPALAIMCTWRPTTFRNLLNAFGSHKNEFLSAILCNNGNSITLFETTLILAAPEICREIYNIYKESNPDLLSRNQPKKALKTCCELNSLFYTANPCNYLTKLQARFKPYNREQTKNNICSQIDCFPLYYHAPIINLAHLAFNIPISELEAKVANKSEACMLYFKYVAEFGDSIKQQPSTPSTAPLPKQHTASRGTGGCFLF